MFRGAGKLGRILICIIALLAASTLAVVLVGDGQRCSSEAAPLASSGWFRIRHNISQSGDRTSALPRIALGKDGGNDRYIVVVWSDSYNTGTGAVGPGHIYLRWVDEQVGAWSYKVQIDGIATASADHWAAEPALAVNGTTAHIAWAEFAAPSSYSLLYQTCTLNSATHRCDLGSPEQIAAGSESMGRPDIALDNSGRPHVVWQQGEGENQRAYYKYRVAANNWQSEFPDSLLSEGDVDGKNDHPSLAANSDGAIVATWSVNFSLDTPQQGDRKDYISSRRKAPSWAAANRLFSKDLPVEPEAISANPSVASDGNTVYIVWDKHTYGQDKFRLYYKKSTDGGVNWTPSGSDGKYWEPDGHEYDSSEVTPVEIDYKANLQPAAFVDGDDDLHAVWHRRLIVGGGDEPITYDQWDVMYWSTDLPKVTGVSGTQPITVATMSADGGVLGDNNVAADVAVGYYNGEWHLHVVAMLFNGTNWDVYYLSNNRYNSVCLPIIMKNYE